jgi:hypothetical protein
MAVLLDTLKAEKPGEINKHGLPRPGLSLLWL